MRQVKFIQAPLKKGQTQTVLWELKAPAQLEAVKNEFIRWKEQNKPVGDDFIINKIRYFPQKQKIDLILIGEKKSETIVSISFALSEKYNAPTEGAPEYQANFYVPLESYFCDEQYCPDGVTQRPYEITSLSQVAQFAYGYRNHLVGDRKKIEALAFEKGLRKLNERTQTLQKIAKGEAPTQSAPNFFRDSGQNKSTKVGKKQSQQPNVPQA